MMPLAARGWPLVLAVLAAAAWAAPQLPAAAQPLFSPEGPSHVALRDGSEAALFQQVLAAVTMASRAVVEGRDVPTGGGVGVAAAAAAAAAPPNASAPKVANMLGRVLAAASLQSQMLGSLGNPGYYWYAGRHALYRLPSGPRVRGTCVFIHGCKHDPESFFYQSRACPACTGLPEEVAHTKQCLARGYAVLALASKNRDRGNRCFSSSSNPWLNDHAEAADAIRGFTLAHGLRRKPVYMIGVSSGASFAVKFPRTMRIHGIISEVNMPWEKNWGVTDGRGRLLVKPYPPTAFYWMKRDAQTKRQMEQATAILRRNGVYAASVYSPPRRVSPAYLSSRSMAISPLQSALIRRALIKLRVLDKNGWVRFDVRLRTGWTRQLMRALPWLGRDKRYLNLIQDESQIWQELNVAWSMHEIVADYVRPTLMWLESRGRANLTRLVQRHSLRGRLSCLNERREGCR